VDKEENREENLPRQRLWVAAVAGVIILFAAGVALFGDFAWVPAATGAVDQEATNGTVQAIAEPLFTDWVLAFEATALLLTIAAAGAVVLAQFRRKRT
jgi:NADH-quinone oxidoreductase subunit J